jgi:DNA processing protein
MADELYWIWFSLICGTQYNLSEKLLVHYDMNPECVFSANDREISELCDRHLKNSFTHELDETQSIKEYCIKNKIGLLTPDNEYYPERLRKIKDKPSLLYYRGKLPDFNNRLCITAVGTRRMTEYGKRSAYTITYDLAKCGAVIISGMALGVDGVCHRAALDAGGQTVAVLGCGIDRVYPLEHEALMNEIIAGGAVITEFKPTTPPAGFNFPIRNRIMSGLSQGTFVIEADKRSGAMITARTAIYQGRDIFALPGKVGEMNSGGTNSLIQHGAKMVTTALDILEDYAGLYPTAIKVEKSAYRSPEKSLMRPADGVNLKKKSAKAASKDSTERKRSDSSDTHREPVIQNTDGNNTVIIAATQKNAGRPDKIILNKNEQQIYDMLPDGVPVTADAIARKGFPVSQVLTIMTMLEIKGIIKVLPGGQYKKL